MTLLGVLVALVLTAMTGLLIAQSFALTDRLMARQEHYKDSTSLEFDALASLRLLIEQAEPPYGDHHETRFEGAKDSLTFASRPEWLTGGKIVRVEILMDKENEQLLLRTTTLGDAEEKDSLVLAGGVRRISFTYYGAGPTESATPTDSWRDRKRLPDLIVARVEFDDPAREREVSIRLRRTYSTACLVFGWTDCLQADP